MCSRFKQKGDATMSTPSTAVAAEPGVDALATTHRIAFVLAPTLDRGAAGNRCAVLATGLAAKHPEIIGANLNTSDGLELLGFTKVPIVVLVGKDEPLRLLAERARALGCTTLVFLARAQGMRSYE